ncbi:MAG: leucyl aminopeptidase [Bacteroidales bacterium]|nr:leucyl aminopeptidase [Bacteroidales bacterium]
MSIKINLNKDTKKNDNIVFIGDIKDFKVFELTGDQKKYIDDQFKNDKSIVTINQYNSFIYFINFTDKIVKNKKEIAGKIGSKLVSIVDSYKQTSVSIIETNSNFEVLYAFIEGIVLGNYKFIKYYKDIKSKKSSLNSINIISSSVNKNNIYELQNILKAVYITRDLANEPFSGLNAIQLADRIIELGKDSGFKVSVFDKEKIAEQKMGGLLAVNKGSEKPPTFSIMEWKPDNAKNTKPIILVGKGIVFDTGGYSIKPTKNSMDMMKFDMAGAAAVIGTMYAVSKNKLPLHIIALIPATDNAVDAKAYVPGDVIKMHNGLFVEVLNTDAEGRLILADALSYAQKDDPELVIDLATLTGSAAVALGTEAAVVMGTAGESVFNKLEKSGEDVYERVVKFPFWDEYKEMLKSNIADIKNIGGREAGAVTAGKFLEYFTEYPWIHIDIAGPAMLSKKSSYRTVGGSGYGVRLLYDFLKNYES